LHNDHLSALSAIFEGKDPTVAFVVLVNTPAAATLPPFYFPWPDHSTFPLHLPCPP
jgi:hypothetical protein